MGYSGSSIYLRLQTAQYKPCKDELKAIHDYFNQLFYHFCQSRLEGASQDYFRDATCFGDDVIRLEQEEINRTGENLWDLSWWVYSHQEYTALEHWLSLFLAKESQRLGNFSWFEVVPYEQTLRNLLFAKPLYYQYITLERGFYLLHTYNEEIVGLKAAAGIAPEDFEPVRNELIPLQFFTPEEQGSILEARISEVCVCPICVSLRKDLDGRCQNIEINEPSLVISTKDRLKESKKTEPLELEDTITQRLKKSKKPENIEIESTIEPLNRPPIAIEAKIFPWERYPVIFLIVELDREKTLGQVCQLLVLCLESVNILPNPDWLIEEEVSGEGLVEMQLEEILSRKDYPDEETQLSIYLDDSLTTIAIAPSKFGGWCIQIYFHSSAMLEEGISRSNLESLMDVLLEVCREFLRHTPVRNACIGRDSQQITIVPRLPLIRYGNNPFTHAIVTTVGDVERCYEYPEVFWNAGWSSIEQYGQQYLLAREQHTFDNLDFLRAVSEIYWELARATKPGLTEYKNPNPRPEEKEIFLAGAPSLQLLGFRTKEQLIEYTYPLECKRHIQGWEIYELRQWLKKNILEDGVSIQGVRVVFYDRAMAEREKRPLLDNKIKLVYIDERCQDVEVTE